MYFLFLRPLMRSTEPRKLWSKIFESPWISDEGNTLQAMIWNTFQFHIFACYLLFDFAVFLDVYHFLLRVTFSRRLETVHFWIEITYLYAEYYFAEGNSKVNRKKFNVTKNGTLRILIYSTTSEQLSLKPILYDRIAYKQCLSGLKPFNLSLSE